MFWDNIYAGSVVNTHLVDDLPDQLPEIPDRKLLIAPSSKDGLQVFANEQGAWTEISDAAVRSTGLSSHHSVHIDPVTKDRYLLAQPWDESAGFTKDELIVYKQDATGAWLPVGGPANQTGATKINPFNQWGGDLAFFGGKIYVAFSSYNAGARVSVYDPQNPGAGWQVSEAIPSGSTQLGRNPRLVSADGHLLVFFQDSVTPPATSLGNRIEPVEQALAYRLRASDGVWVPVANGE